MPRAFTENEREIIVKALLEQGHKLFAVRGLKKTSVEELATAAGISKGAFYVFYESKEALFMDVVEEAERDFRKQILAALYLPGPTPHARLVAGLRKAFALWRTVPILHIFTQADYALIARRMPKDKIQEHLASDQHFTQELVTHCRQAGIPIQAPAARIDGLLHALFFVSLHEDDLGPDGIAGTLDLLIELMAAYGLGEITVPPALLARETDRSTGPDETTD